METVKLTALFHRNEECIGIFSPQNATLNYYYQKKAGAKWSRSNKCWYVPCTEKNYELLCTALKGRAILEVEELKKYLLEKKKRVVAGPVHKVTEEKTAIKTYSLVSVKPVQKVNTAIKLSKENNDALQKFKQQLVLLIKSFTAQIV